MERTLDAGSASLANSARKMAQLQAGAGLLRVPMHLLDQRLERVETYFVAQASDEIDVEVAPVEVAIEIEQMNLEQRDRAVERRSGAEARDGRERREARTIDPDGEDAPERDHLSMQREVGRREAQFAPQPLSELHPAADPVRPAEQPRRNREIAGFERGANQRAADAYAFDLEGRHFLDREA